MLLSIFRQYPIKLAIPLALCSVVIVLFSLSFHECAHAVTALALGDPTAKNRGRVSLNPMKHLNPIGTLCMLIAGFGWAEPVPINPNYFKNRKGGMALSALAGPVSNFLLAFIALIFESLIYKIAGGITSMSSFTVNFLSVAALFFYLMHIMNLNLAIFNFIPVPPLDGSRILFTFLPSEMYFKVMKYEQYIAVALIILLYVGVLDGPLSFIVTAVSNGMQSIVNLIF